MTNKPSPALFKPYSKSLHRQFTTESTKKLLQFADGPRYSELTLIQGSEVKVAPASPEGH